MIKVIGLNKKYGKGHAEVEVLNGIDLEYRSGEFLGIFGSSGSGKSTLLHIMGGLERPTAGQVLIEGKNLYAFTEDTIARYRNRTVGFVFQFYHLLPEFSAEENVEIPCLISGMKKGESKKRAREVLEKVGLGHRMSHRPSELSGGEQQRVAVARAIIMKPKVLFADEPTGNLDKTTGAGVIDLLKSLNDEGMGIVMVTHDQGLASCFERRLELVDGKLV